MLSKERNVGSFMYAFVGSMFLSWAIVDLCHASTWVLIELHLGMIFTFAFILKVVNGFKAEG